MQKFYTAAADLLRQVTGDKEKFKKMEHDKLSKSKLYSLLFSNKQIHMPLRHVVKLG